MLRGAPADLLDNASERLPIAAGVLGLSKRLTLEADAPCWDASGTPRRLFEVLRGTHFTLLAFGCHAALEGLPPNMKVVHVVQPGRPMRSGAQVDVAGHARQAYGVSDAPALVLTTLDRLLTKY